MPRRHKGNQGGRPTNKERYDKQQGQIDRLRQLVVHRRQADETWHLVDRLLTLINELEDMDTPIRAATYDGDGGHSVERPILPGVQITERGIVHAGSYAGDLLKWFYRQVRWTIATTERRLEHKEPDPRPAVPKPPPRVNNQEPAQLLTERNA